MPPRRIVIPTTDPEETIEDSSTPVPDVEHQPSPAPSVIRHPSVISDTPTPNLAEAISLMTEELRRREKHPVAKVKEPDTFDGSDPRKLNNFILFCNLYF